MQDSRHNLTVIQPWADAAMPLTLQSLVIKRSPGASQATSPHQNPIIVSSTHSSSAAPSSQPSGGGGVPVGILAGAISGGLALLVILTSGWFFVYRRRRQTRYTKPTLAVSAVPQPFRITADDTNVIAPGKDGNDRVNIDMQELAPPLPTKWSRGSSPRRSRGGDFTSLETIVGDQAAQGRWNHIGHSSGLNLIDLVGSSQQDRSREEDSGIRVAREEDTPSFMPLDPPIYTVH